jgi:glycosyltransferase involved in cell wall biosynthesis
LSYEKGPDVFVESLAIMAGQGTDVYASIIGDGPLRSALTARVAELQLSDRVTFHGQTADAHRLYSAFDVFVMSSRTEGTPIVLFEAMAASVPVVATAVGGIPEIVGPVEAALVASEDPHALAAAITASLSDPEQAGARAGAALARLRTDFSSQPWLAAYEALYRRLPATRNSGN